MATLAELVADVYTITNRPDLVAQTAMAVKAATLKAHQSDFYYKDLYETGITFDAEDYLQSLEYRSLIPQFRALKYIRKSDVNETDGTFLTIIPPEHSLDSYGVDKEDVAYLAGSVINIRSSTTLQYIYLGCYLNPVITDTGYNSWIAIDHPYAIVYEAASHLFKFIGFDEQATMFQRLVAEQYAELRMSNILPVGY